MGSTRRGCRAPGSVWRGPSTATTPPKGGKTTGASSSTSTRGPGSRLLPRMAGSFRRRLFTIAALAVLACGAAIVAILYLSRTTMDERNEHVRENVTREIERLQGTLSALPPAARVSRKWQSGTLQSGYVRPDERGEVDPVVVLALQRVAGVGDLAALDREADGTPVMGAAAPGPGGGDVYALQPVVAGRETRGLRIVVVVLALLSLGLIVASLRALRAVERDLSTLRASLAALAKDLSAPLAR